MSSNTYDAIVIGGGHNGLTRGAYFARHGARTVVLEARQQDRRRRRHERPVRRPPRDQRHHLLSYVMSLMPPTIIRRAAAEAARLRRHAVRSVLPGRSPTAARSRSTPTTRRRRYDSIAQFSKKDADTLPRVGGVDEGRRRRARPAAAAACRPTSAPRSSATCSERRRPRGRCASSASARRRRRHPAVHDERHRPAERLVRVRRDQGDADGQRRDRHVGRPRRARAPPT